MVKVILISIVLVASCGGETVEKENICDQANRIYIDSVDSACSSKSCCWCRLWNRGEELNTFFYATDGCISMGSRIIPYDPYNCAPVGSDYSKNEYRLAKDCTDDEGECQKKWMDFAVNSCNQYP